MIWEIDIKNTTLYISVEEAPIKPKVQINYCLQFFTMAPIRNV